jgi:hypothetical protein
LMSPCWTYRSLAARMSPFSCGEPRRRSCTAAFHSPRSRAAPILHTGAKGSGVCFCGRNCTSWMLGCWQKLQVIYMVCLAVIAQTGTWHALFLQRSSATLSSLSRKGVGSSNQHMPLPQGPSPVCGHVAGAKALQAKVVDEATLTHLSNSRRNLCQDKHITAQHSATHIWSRRLQGQAQKCSSSLCTQHVHTSSSGSSNAARLPAFQRSET